MSAADDERPDEAVGHRVRCARVAGDLRVGTPDVERLYARGSDRGPVARRRDRQPADQPRERRRRRHHDCCRAEEVRIHRRAVADTQPTAVRATVQRSSVSPVVRPSAGPSIVEHSDLARSADAAISIQRAEHLEAMRIHPGADASAGAVAGSPRPRRALEAPKPAPPASGHERETLDSGDADAEPGERTGPRRRPRTNRCRRA